MQSGRIYLDNKKWYLRYYTGRMVVNSKGKTVRERPAVFITEYDDKLYRTGTQVEKHPKVVEILRPVTGGGQPGELTFQRFVDDVYLPYVEANKRPSTAKGYRNLYRGVIKPHLNGTLLKSFGVPAAQKVINQIRAERNPTTRTLIHVKSFMTEALWHGLRNAYFGENYVGGNPLAGESLNLEGRRSGPTHAYTLAEVNSMLTVLKNDTYKTIVTVAAYTGLRVSELRGLRWTDVNFKDGTLVVNQSYWGKAADETKTEASRGAVPMIKSVIDALTAHRAKNPMTKFVFEGSHLAPIDIESVGSKKIREILRAKGQTWYGWHAFRRGLGTTLRAMSVEMETITAIMRHANSKVTEERYAKPSAEVNAAAMDKLNTKVGGKSV
jgi:integrase